MVGIYEWYIDVFFFVNFLMDAAGLFAAGVLCNQKIRLARILTVCAAATGCSIWLLFHLPAYTLYLLAVHIVLNPLMVLMCYCPKSWRDFLRSLLAVYLVLFLAGGVQQSFRLYGMGAAGQILFAGLLAVGIFLIWEVRRRVLGCVCPVELELSGERITITAFCDSGNLLRDPDSGKAVNVIQRSALPTYWLRSEMRDSGAKGNLSKEMQKENTVGLGGVCEKGLHEKELRRISFRTVGTDRSKMEIITLDKMRIYKRGRVYEVEKPVFGLFDGTLFERPRVEMLLNGAYA